MPGVVRLQSIEYSRHGVFLRFAFSDLRFATTLWYEDVDLHHLSSTISEEALQRVLFHIALFEINKICSLRPDRIELGPYARFYTKELAALLGAVFRNVFAQWRYENDDPEYLGPAFPAPAFGPAAPLTAPAAQDAVLAFCGGGKDSLVMLRLLQQAGIAYDSYAYSSSIYGTAAAQHQLLDGLLSRVAPRRRLRQFTYDDFLDAPVSRLHPDLPRTVLAAETPAALFSALPVVLQHGHRALCLGHERSAETGQRRWARTGESINHQWGKSRAAEALLSGYIREHLVSGLSVWSPLRPVHDVVLFSLLGDSPKDVPFTHSCNVRKPWCLHCPKCLYVFLGCAAFLPREVLVRTFGTDALLSDPARAAGFAALAETDGQPFECIGHAEEARILFGACLARSYEGPALSRFQDRHGGPAAQRALLSRYLDVDLSLLPQPFRARLGPLLLSAAASAGDHLRGLLVGP